MAVSSVGDAGKAEVISIRADEANSAPSSNDSSHEKGNILADSLAASSDSELQRRLSNRQIQLFAIGGTIGGAVFLAMGGALAKGGPGSLFLGYLFHAFIQAMTTTCEAEMATFMPITAGFIQRATRWVDEAWGFMVGWNYYIYMALGIPFELVSVSIVLGFWRDDIPVAAVICVLIVVYVVLNVFAVNWYGEAEFWMSLGKVLLFAIVFSFTFVTMVGGNPQRDAYGFRYWNNPGAFLEYVDTGSLGRFQGFLAGYYQASYVITGPDYVSMVAGEAKNPRVTIKNAFKTMYLRFAIFFIGSALCIGIILPANDPTLLGVLAGTEPGAGTGAASPYVIAAVNMGIPVLPSVINALLLTSLLSAGNNYVFSSTRALYSLAVRGQAPKVFLKCTKKGVPIYAMAASMLFSVFAFLQLSNSSATVYYWMVSIGTAGGLINFLVMTTTYIFFFRALKAQGIDRATLPYRGWFQPYLAYFASVWLTLVLFTFGYVSFVFPWDNATFFSYYTLLLLAPVTFTFWKIVKRSKIVKPHEADLVWERPAIDAHEATLTGVDVGFWGEMGQLVGIKRRKVTQPE